ncbi:MAG TPA: hypothetical protein ENF64_00950 [Hadesarchaea archaeon]|nr:hypothetical protein [Hadesarchaea archaeon]
MMLDISPFVGFLRRRDLKKARDWLEQNKRTMNVDDEFVKGYLLALSGMVSGLEGGELSVIKQLVNGGYQDEGVERLARDLRERLSLKFRPRDEQGFDTAWLELLQEFMGK